MHNIIIFIVSFEILVICTHVLVEIISNSIESFEIFKLIKSFKW